MPSSQFKFELSNDSTAFLDVRKSRVTGLKEGFTKLTLVDKSIFFEYNTV